MIVFFSNQPDKLFHYSIQLNAATPVNPTLPKDSVAKTYKTIAAFAASLKDETGKSLKWKEKKKLLKEQIRAIKNDDDKTKGEKTALIILSVVVALGLSILVYSLACNLSCSGAEGAAVIVGVGGAAVIVFLLAIAIKAITGKKKKPKNEEIKPEDRSKMGVN